MCVSDSFSARRPLAALLVGLMLAVAPVQAAVKKADPNKAQIQRLQQAQKVLEQEKASIAGELEAEKKKAEEEAQRAEALKREAGSLRAARDQTKTKLTETEAKLTEIQTELRRAKEEHQALLERSEAEKKRLQQELALGKQQFAACVDRDRELRKVSATVLDLYEKKSCSDSVWQKEPFTGLKRVEIENAVEDLREKLDAPAMESQASVSP